MPPMRFSPISEEASETEQHKSHVKNHRLRSDIRNRISPWFVIKEPRPTTSAKREGNLRYRRYQWKALVNLLDRPNVRAPETQRGTGACATLVHEMGRVARLEPPPAALDGLLRSTPPQFAALGTIVAVITAAILSPCSRSLIRTRRGVRVRRRRLRGYTASCHRSLHARSRDRWFGAAAAGSRRRLALRSSGRRRPQCVLSLSRLSTGES